MKRKIQDEDETDVPEEVPKKKFKVEEDVNITVEDEKMEHQNDNSGAIYEKEVR